MVSIRFTVSLIFLAWGLSLLVEAQDCSTFSLPNKTRWLKGDGNTFECTKRRRTIAQSSCVNGKWEISPVCKVKEIDRCRKIQCLNSGTCVNGTCVCPTGRYGKYCKGCNVSKGVYMSSEVYLGLINDLATQEECDARCAELPECSVAFFSAKICRSYKLPYLGIKFGVKNVDECVQTCYANPRCTGFNFFPLTKYCDMYNTTVGNYTLEKEDYLSPFTSERNCEDLFTEDR